MNQIEFEVLSSSLNSKMSNIEKMLNLNSLNNRLSEISTMELSAKYW